MTTKKEALEQSQKAFYDYFNLSRFLFGSDKAPSDVNEIPENSPFYKTARLIAKEMKLNWKDMSHEDSNRVMLNLLAEYYAKIKTDDNYMPVLTISFKEG